MFNAAAIPSVALSQDTRKLVHRDHIVVPRKLKRLRRRRARQDVVKLATHHERPRIVQSLLRIHATALATPRRSKPSPPHQQAARSSVPAFLISLRSDRTGGVIGQQQIAFVTRQSLICSGRMLRNICSAVDETTFNGPSPVSPTSDRSRHDRFHHAHGVFAWRAACVAGAVIVIVSEKPADFSVAFDAARPINRIVSRVWIRRRTLADVFSDLTAVAAGIQCGDECHDRQVPATSRRSTEFRVVFLRSSLDHQRAPRNSR